VLARMLTPSDYGLVAMVAVVYQFVAIFSDMGLSISTVQQDKITHQQVSNLFWVNMLVTVGLGILMAISSPLIAWFYSDPRITSISLWTAATFPLVGLTLQHYALLRRQMRFATIARIQMASMIVSVSAALIAAYLGIGYWSLIVMNISGLAFSVPMVWIATKWIPGWFAKKQGTRAHIAFGGYLTASNIAGYFFKNMDRILIGKFCSAQELGIYDRAYQLIMMPLSRFIYPLTNLTMPVLSRLQDDPVRYRKVYIEIQEKMCFIIAPLIGVVVAYSDWIIVLILGDQWLDASAIFVWLSLSGMLQATLGLVVNLFISQRRVKEHFYWQIVSATIATISYIIGIPWGAKGVAISFGLSAVLLDFPLYTWWAGRKGPVATFDIVRPVVSFATYGFFLALIFHIFRSMFKFGDSLFVVVTVLTISLLIGYFSYFIVPHTRTLAYDLIQYRKQVFNKKS